MKILVTSDLHYDITRSREPAQRLAAQVRAAGGDALVLVGDSAGADLAPLRECLALFADFPGRRLFVPGNHCLWCNEEASSLDRYERVLPAVAAEAGFEMLDLQPVVLGEVGLVGSVGWYDYGFRDESLEIPEPFYAAKVAPGAAAYFEEHRHLVEKHRAALSERHYSMGSRWMDGVKVKLGMSDAEFVTLLVARLDRQLRELSPRVKRIVAFLHHLPFVELVPRDVPARFAFAAAYMGAEGFGAALQACPKVTDVYCGHSHWPDRRRVGHVNVVAIGSTYTEKRLETLEI